MVKVALNRCYGGFKLSEAGACMYKELAGAELNVYRFDSDSARTDAHLVRVIETLGCAAGSTHSALEIVDVPDDAQWTIKEYDGQEWVAEVHRTWE